MEKGAEVFIILDPAYAENKVLNHLIECGDYSGKALENGCGFYLSCLKDNKIKLVISQWFVIILFAFEAIRGYNYIRK